MRITALALALLAPVPLGAADWHVSDADPFGWRRAVVIAGDDRLAVVCPPDAAPFAVPVVGRAEAVRETGTFTLGLEIDGARYDQPMTCSDVLCVADLPQRTWRALVRGRAVNLWIDDRRGPSFPLRGSADALATCSPGY
jgi:hypothetical protein